MKKVICNKCNDSHMMPFGEDRCEVMCTFCPVPCQRCRMGGHGAFCEETPCKCSCHPENKKSDPDWYKGPLTKEHIASLREKLGVARGIIQEFLFIMNETPEALIGFLSLSKEDLENVIKETAD